MEELRKCPFCGGYAHLDKTGTSPTFRKAAVYCEGCDIWFVVDDLFASEEDIITAWNRRITKP